MTLARIVNECLGMTREDLVDNVVLRAGFPDRPDTEHLVQTALRALARAMAGPPREIFCSAIPRDLLGSVSGNRHEGGADPLGTVVARVAEDCGLCVGRALEVVQLVSSVIAGALDPASRSELIEGVDPQIGELFELAEPGEPPVPPAVRHGRGHTLASGKPGSRRPLSDSRPIAGQSHSIVRERNPHGETKLSSGEPSEPDPLARTPPGSHRPLIERPRD